MKVLEVLSLSVSVRSKGSVVVWPGLCFMSSECFFLTEPSSGHASQPVWSDVSETKKGKKAVPDYMNQATDKLLSICSVVWLPLAFSRVHMILLIRPLISFICVGPYSLVMVVDDGACSLTIASVGPKFCYVDVFSQGLGESPNSTSCFLLIISSNSMSQSTKLSVISEMANLKIPLLKMCMTEFNGL